MGKARSCSEYAPKGCACKRPATAAGVLCAVCAAYWGHVQFLEKAVEGQLDGVEKRVKEDLIFELAEQFPLPSFEFDQQVYQFADVNLDTAPVAARDHSKNRLINVAAGKTVKPRHDNKKKKSGSKPKIVEPLELQAKCEELGYCSRPFCCRAT